MTEDPLELAAERSIRNIARLVGEDPEAGARLEAALSGELAGLEEEFMAASEYVPLRLPAGLVARLDALIGPLAAAREVSDPGAIGSVTRSEVARRALALGVEALEAKHGLTAPTRTAPLPAAGAAPRRRKGAARRGAPGSGPALLAAWLEREGVSPSALAKRIGLSGRVLQFYRAGKRTPSPEAAAKIEEATGIARAAWQSAR